MPHNVQMESAYPLSHGLSGEQLDLIYGGMRNIEQDFWRYEHANPKVYKLIVNLARTVKAAGYETYSMDAILHRLRWHYAVDSKSKEPFKVNDHYSSFYARLVMAREPDLANFFTLRKQRSKGK